MGERTTVVRDGRELKFCCEPCVGKFDKNPAKYLPKLAGK
jgi:YHS domain-containing protein